MTKQEFVNAIRPVTEEVKTAYGIQPEITIGQALHESTHWGDGGAWGLSKLALTAFNLFGFTGESWQSQGKPIMDFPTTEYLGGKPVVVHRPFRRYASWADAIYDWGRLIVTPRYTKAYAAAKIGDAAGYGREVAAAGYATDPQYAEKITPWILTAKNLLSSNNA